MSRLVTLAAVLVLAAPAHGEHFPPDRMLRAEVLVPAPVGAVWSAWTTEAGIRSYLAPGGRVDLRVDGAYDVWFDPRAAEGARGADGMRILDVDSLRRFVFTWNAPTTLPVVRQKRTVVTLEFAPAGKDTTRLRFTQSGWGEGAEWDRAFDYFDRAWGAYVLPALIHRFAHGPIDWSAPPKLTPVAATIQHAPGRGER